MPFARPSLPDLRTRVRADFSAHMPGAAAALQLRRSRIGVFGDVLAGVNHLELGYLDWLANGVLMPDTADQEYLVRWAASFAVIRKPPTTASGPVTFLGGAGLPIPLGTVLASQDGTIAYATGAAATLDDSGGATVAITATVAGVAGNQVAGTALQLRTAIGGVDPAAIVGADGLGGGADAEDIEALRQRLLLRLRTPPQGGAGSDYVQWALAVPGVTRAWAYPLARGAGTVNVVFAMDGRANPLPLPADVAIVQAALDLVAPVTADVLAAAPVAFPIPIWIGGLSPSSDAIQAAALAELADLFAQQGPGGAVIGSGVSDGAPGGALYRNEIEAAITAAAGVSHFVLLLPATDQVLAAPLLPTLGTVVFS